MRRWGAVVGRWGAQVQNALWRGSLQTQNIVLAVLLVLVVLAATAVPVMFLISDTLEQEIGTRARDIARTFAVSPALQAGFDSEDPVAAIAPMADRIRQSTGADFVIVMDRAGRRYAASDPSELGKATVGLDYGPALMEGRAFYARVHEGRTPALAGVAPVFRPGGELVGMVAVGFQLEAVDLWIRSVVQRVALAAAVGLGIGVVGAVLLARHTKAQMFGLEPRQIAALLESRTAILQAVREGIVAVDGEGRLTVINDEASAILGLPPDAVGRPMAEVLPSSRLTEILASGEAVFDQEMIVNDRVVVVNQMPLRYRGQPMGAVASFRDRTELQQLAGELNAVRRYSDALRAQAHEFRNRLHAVAGLIELGALDEALELIMRVQGQEQDLLDQLVRTISEPMIQAIILGKYHRAAELHVRLELDPASRLERARAELGVEMLVTILGNLLDNAIEAVADLPEPDRWVRLYLNDTGPTAVIAVTDGGPGVSPEFRSRIFQDGYSTRRGGRRGFGLALVHLLVKQVGGQITVEQDPSRFSVTIPMEVEA